MQKLAIGIAAIAALTGTPALAADMALKSAPPTLPLPTWTGFYLGAHIGGGAESNASGSWFDPNIGGIPSPLAVPTQSEAGFVGGVQAGYNWQFAPTWVVGIEGDFSASGIDSQGNLAPVPSVLVGGSRLTMSTRSGRLASARGRFGYIAGNTLWYATGGAAWDDVKYIGNGVFGGGFTDATSFWHTNAGWVAGGGVEWMVTPHFLVRAEYLYYGFDKSVIGNAPYVPTFFGAVSPVFTWSGYNIQVGRLGLDYKF